MKHLSKSAAKTAVRKIILDAMSKVFKTTSTNGYKIADRGWDSFTKEDFENFENFDQIITKYSDTMFLEETLGYFRNVLASVYYNDLILVSDADIKKQCKQYASARNAYLKTRAREKAEYDEQRAAEIKMLEERLAELKAETNGTEVK